MAKRKRGPNGLPWYYKSRDCWIIPGLRSKTPIRDDRGRVIKGRGNRDAAFAAWKKLDAIASAVYAGDDAEVYAVFNLFLTDRKPAVVAKRYYHYVAAFSSFCGRWPGLRVRDLRPAHVTAWFADHPGWKPSTRRHKGTMLKAAFKWASDPGGGNLIGRHPLSGMRLPPVGRRSAATVVTEAEFRSVYDAIPAGHPLRDLLLVTWETGTRPCQLIRADVGDVAADGRALVARDHKRSRQTGDPVYVPLSDVAAAVVARLAAGRADGPLFRNSHGRRWGENFFSRTLRKFTVPLGMGGRFTPYSCRHSRATEMLEQGMPDVDVAAILGNSPAVIHRHYNHVAAKVGRSADLLEASRQKSRAAADAVAAKDGVRYDAAGEQPGEGRVAG